MLNRTKTSYVLSANGTSCQVRPLPDADELRRVDIYVGGFDRRRASYVLALLRCVKIVFWQKMSSYSKKLRNRNAVRESLKVVVAFY